MWSDLSTERTLATEVLPMRIRYRKPSLKTALGITAANKQLKRELGIYKVTKVLNAPKNAKRSVKRSFGWESEWVKLSRFIARLFKN